jgi:hypothetical protein
MDGKFSLPRGSGQTAKSGEIETFPRIVASVTCPACRRWQPSFINGASEPADVVGYFAVTMA